MKVFIGADYRGFETKNQILKLFVDTDYEVIDVGAYTYHEGDDFNDPAITVARNVRENHGSFGILVCDSAHGVTMQANRFKGVRAANCHNAESAKLAREHDDANVLCISAHFMNDELMKDIIFTFLETKHEGLDRRARRINRLDEREDYD
ncbi:RpiB/LacA/LacB family sugar-phosphate isomerase [Candidatus Saccharibacteria bacterium]|nr:RpiB/LacA/LacB family sugar-phosphate isomerase [Candidatus Saccharibacteria bacterium]